jgi:hypothetical protein
MINLLKCCLITAFLLGMQIAKSQTGFYTEKNGSFELTEAGAARLAALPMKCLEKEFPYKTGIVFLDSSLVTAPKNYHPAFFGCYDWHSSVHGHWMLVRLLKEFPQMSEATNIRNVLKAHLSSANIQKELQIFKADNASFERIYGWGWLLYLQRELILSDQSWAREASRNLQPLADYFSAAWIRFLDKIVYPIRVGEHSNLAFGLNFTWEYAVTAKDTALQNGVRSAAFRFYSKDINCPVSWEPGGYDFLSPCLEEAKLMGKLLHRQQYSDWLKQFMPALLTDPSSVFQIATVKDRSDGKLVHLDGLNLSRAACLLEIADHLPVRESGALRQLGKQHLRAALPALVSGQYAGEHWLASFAVYALISK